MGLFGGGRRAAPRMDPYLEQYNKTLSGIGDQSQALGAEASGAGVAGLLNFDPTDAIRTYAGAQWDQAQTGMKQELADLAGSAAGNGRLDTGFFNVDRGDVYRRTVSDFNNKIASTAVQAAGMQMGKYGSLINAGQDYSGTAADIASGGMDRRQAELNAAAEQKAADRARRRGIFGKVAGAAAGSIFGPSGAAIGSKLGSAVTDYLG